MHLTDLLSAQRVAIRHTREGDPPLDKAGAIALLASLLGAPGSGEPGSGAGASDQKIEVADIERVLLERERLQSTGIGEGVAIPHGAMTELTAQVAALLIAPEGVEFAAIDDRKVTIIFGVIGPKRATGEHLKTLARVSRLLRNPAFRSQLVASSTSEAVYTLIATEEGEAR